MTHPNSCSAWIGLRALLPSRPRRAAAAARGGSCALPVAGGTARPVGFLQFTLHFIGAGPCLGRSVSVAASLQGFLSSQVVAAYMAVVDLLSRVHLCTHHMCVRVAGVLLL